MRVMLRFLAPLAALVVFAVPASAQTREGLVGDLLKDIGSVERKVLALAKAMPDAAWKWTPGAGVRSTGEVFMHIAADNYYMPVTLGTPAPAETKITKDYDTAAAFEKKPLGRDAVIAEIGKSFAFLKKSLADLPDAKVDAPVEMFGQKTTTRGAWISTVTHLHEHLGQLIAYARANKVVPPWSK
jgi:uncharacterized damage-inducible protein DinB